MTLWAQDLLVGLLKGQPMFKMIATLFANIIINWHKHLRSYGTIPEVYKKTGKVL
jgi:hypothetical protein